MNSEQRAEIVRIWNQPQRIAVSGGAYGAVTETREERLELALDALKKSRKSDETSTVIDDWIRLIEQAQRVERFNPN